uniref:LOW QUALITY PROTEIN: interferon-induced protein with tetratricopeptide repeats 3-like n=1 Tax=Semicossyphus pulcher TaxID=241346 RepID=UPI0037E71397
MSAAHNQTSLESLQCHFTWDLDRRRSILLLLRENLEDVRTEEGNRWMGHIFNLWEFIQYKLGFTEDAQGLFNKAADAFKQVRNADNGPWLVVNYGNLAWLHHHLGEPAESQAYLSKVDALMREYPSPTQDELHPEIYAERAWTLMYLRENMSLVVDLFKKAVRMQPDMVEWNTSYVLSLISAHNHSDTGLDADLLEKMRHAKEQDPENLYLAALYLEQLAKKGERIEDKACEIAKKVLRTPVCSYNCLRALLRVYTHHISVDEAIDLAEEALKKHPDQRYLKRCVAFDFNRSIQYHMNAAAIPEKSFFRENSIRYLEKAKNRGRMCREIEEFLENLQEPTS